MTGSIKGYQASGIAMASGGTAAQVQAWVVNRPSSAGIPGGPNRGLQSVPADSHVTVCVLEGDFPYPAPPLPNGSNPPPATGARVFLLSNGTAVLDAEGPLSGVESRTPTTFAAGG
ncbi:MAG: hypothetical protein ACYDEP_03880 [Acidimicrobiales bacterium]